MRGSGNKQCVLVYGVLQVFNTFAISRHGTKNGTGGDPWPNNVVVYTIKVHLLYRPQFADALLF